MPAHPAPAGGAGNGDPAPALKRAALWYWLLIPAMLWLMQGIVDRERVQPIAYSEFKQLLHAGKLRDLSLSSQAIDGVFQRDGAENILPRASFDPRRCDAAGACRFTTVRVADPELAHELEAAGVHFEGRADSALMATLLGWAVPLLFLFWLLRMSQGKAGMGASWLLDVGKSRARIHVASTSDVRFSDVAGIDEARDELVEVVEFLKDPTRYRRLGGKIPKGVLIVGPPGTGKTLLAKALAGEAGVPFFFISGSEFVEMYVGVGAARVRDLFAMAQEKAPCIVFIDELDALGRARGVASVYGGSTEHEQTLNQLLVEMDGFDSTNGVMILAATNRPEVLDPALLRPGRFDRHIALERPDLKGREQILAVHVRQVKLASGVSLATLAARTAGLSGADLANLINEAALLAGRRGAAEVAPVDLEEALDRIVAGLQKKTRVMNRLEKETVAYHEAGHALVAEARPHADRVAKISIIPRGLAALGYTQQLPLEDRYLLKKSELLDRLDVMLGGRVAEELVFGDVSTGAQNDLQLATDMARHMVMQYAMGERLGLATFESATQAPILPPDVLERNRYSEQTAQAIDAEIVSLLGAAHSRVTETLTAQRSVLGTLAQALLAQETLDRAALDALLKGQQALRLLKPAGPPDADRDQEAS